VLTPEELISLAGSQENEKDRHRILSDLLARVGPDSELGRDLEKLLPVIDHWANGLEKYWEPGEKPLPAENGYLCDFFVYRVLPGLPPLVDEDSPIYPLWLLFSFLVERLMPMYPPEVPEDSPLYPVWCMYRGRMLIWQPIQTGSYAETERLRDKYFGEGRRLVSKAAAAFPGNRVLRMYLDEPVPWPSIHPLDPKAPAWANLQREALEKLGAIIRFWIEKRQAPDGQFGGGWGDDVEMWRAWTPILLGFEDPDVNAAQERLASGLFALPSMENGYTTKMTDVEHSAEDSGDTGTAMMHIAPDDPVWQGRAQRLAELMRDLWTGTNDRGLTQFKSTYFTSERVDPSPKKACDTVYHPRAVQPALLYWQRTGDTEMTSLFRDWMDTWVDAAVRSERGKPAGVLPSALHWPDGDIGGLGEDWWDPENHFEGKLYRWPSAMTMMTSSLLLTSHMTGDEKYLEPIQSMAALRAAFLEDPPEEPTPGSAMWCASKMGGFLSDTLGKYRLLTGDEQFDSLLLADAGGYVEYRLTGNDAPLLEELGQVAAAFGINRPAYMEEVRWTDRVFKFHKNYANDYADPPLPRSKTELLYNMLTGDFGNALYFPMNAVRWKTLPQDIAVMVVDHGTTHLSADLYHFGNSSRPMGAGLYLLEPGEYEWTLLAGGQGLSGGQFSVEGTGAQIQFSLPPKRLCTLRIVPLTETRSSSRPATEQG